MKRHLKKTGVQEILALDANGNMESIDANLAGDVYDAWTPPSTSTWNTSKMIIQRVGDIVTISGYLILNSSINLSTSINPTFSNSPSYLRSKNSGGGNFFIALNGGTYTPPMSMVAYNNPTSNTLFLTLQLTDSDSQDRIYNSSDLFYINATYVAD